MSEIIPGLYIGDEHTAMAPDVLEYGCVINATSEVPNSRFIPSETITLRIDVLDVASEGEQDVMFMALRKACDVIHQNLMAGKKVLVHCAEGKQRSCAVVTAYLMFTGKSYPDALTLIRERHRRAFDYGTHFHFDVALAEWEKVLGNTPD
jgi:protein-tyrosine phosphatase